MSQPTLIHTPPMYWSPPESHTQAVVPSHLPMMYYDPNSPYAAGPYMFPSAQHSPQPHYQHPHFQVPTQLQTEPNSPRVPYSQLHPQAPPFVPSGLKALPRLFSSFEPPFNSGHSLPKLSSPSASSQAGESSISFPRSPANQIDPLAHALRRTMPKVRGSTHRNAPGERRAQLASASDAMDSSSISDKFIYVRSLSHRYSFY